MTGSTDQLTQRLTRWLDRAGAVDDLHQYFRDPADSSDVSFTGRWFERLGGGGDAPGNQDAFNAEDLVAVQMLSVSVEAETAVQLLQGELGRRVNEQLVDIPVKLSIADPVASEVLADGAPADKAWRLLDAAPGIGWVTAGKLLARKRPRLIPVYDQVVACALGRPEKFWLSLHDAMVSDDAGVTRRLSSLRETAQVPDEVSDLRILDVAVWMGHRRQHRHGACDQG